MLLELERDPEQRALLADDVEHLVCQALDHPRARVVVLVHAVAEAHQPAADAALHLFDEGRHVVDAADLAQHAQHGFVGAAVQRAVQRRGGTGDRDVRIGARAADVAHHVGRTVLLVIRVQDEQHVERATISGCTSNLGSAMRLTMCRKFVGVAELVATDTRTACPCCGGSSRPPASASWRSGAPSARGGCRDPSRAWLRDKTC